MVAPSIVQSKVARKTSASTGALTATFDVAPTVGRLLVVQAFTKATPVGSAIADNQAGSNAYVQRLTDFYAGLGGRTFTKIIDASSGSFNVSWTPSASAIDLLYIFEIADFNAASIVELSGTYWNAISSGSSPYSPLNFGSTTAAEQLFIASLTCDNGFGRTFSGNTGWTTHYQYTASDSLGGAIITRSVTTTGTYDPEFVITGGSVNTVMQGLSIVGGTDGPSGGGGSAAASKASRQYAQRRRA